jgi:ABC-type Fe3+ transport system permease subunit
MAVLTRAKHSWKDSAMGSLFANSFTLSLVMASPVAVVGGMVAWMRNALAEPENIPAEAHAERELLPV